MTAEVAVMNKSAVALAADSAVTIAHPTGSKIYNSVNKLFTLSKYHPVGIMTYGNAQFMNVPWETIIKQYRNQLSNKEFDTLQEYADDFIEYLQIPDHPLFPESVQKNFFGMIVLNYFEEIIEKIEYTIGSIIEAEGEISKAEVDEIVTNTVNELFEFWKNETLLPNIDQEKINATINLYRETVQEIQEITFGKLFLTNLLKDQLLELIGFLFSRDRFLQFLLSGVVIAGFGRKDSFPCLYSYDIEVLLNGQLKYRGNNEQKISFEQDVIVLSFAQSEMVGTFMDGINPQYKETIWSYIFNLLENYAGTVVDSIPNLDTERAKELLGEISEQNKVLLSDFNSAMREYERKYHVDPIIYNVEYLPKDELAKMAESLVNITSFKRRVSVEEESVGGPIDVAVISKGDGFIWIKRKHYFNPEENPHFIQSYFRE